MNRLQFKVVRELFHELSEKPAGQRSRILAERELDPDVRAEIESLLEPSEGLAGFGDDQRGALGSMLLARKLDEPDEDEPLPEQIGPYRILRKVGEGGMGLVYAARREGAEDLVAVKVIRPSIDSGSFLKRFEREVRVLRKLIHVGIAAFFDEGLATVETATGTATLPYLAMELIDGLPIGLYADQHELNDHQRVELIALVADALQHAHEQGIVHRDLKPSNTWSSALRARAAWGSRRCSTSGSRRPRTSMPTLSP